MSIDDILTKTLEYSKTKTPSGMTVTGYVTIENRKEFKSSLLELLKQAAPEKRPVDKTSQQTDITAAHIGYNQAVDDYLANIERILK